MITMKKFRYLVLAVAGYAALALIINLADTQPSKTRAASSNISNVLVVNPLASPVPTTPVGPTAISGTVPVTQSGLWNVGFTSTPTVNVGNFPGAQTVTLGNTGTQPVPVVSGPGTTPFSEGEHITILLGSRSVAGSQFTPSGTQRLLIDQISWFGAVSTGQKLYGTIFCTTGGNSVSYRFQVASFAPDPNTAGQDDVVDTVPLRIYCDANTTVQVSASRSSSTDSGAFNYGNNYVLSGYLLPL